jgi:hypothetical protein
VIHRLLPMIDKEIGMFDGLGLGFAIMRFINADFRPVNGSAAFHIPSTVEGVPQER